MQKIFTGKSPAYTLLELLIVIAIIGLLATAAVLQLSNTFENSKAKTAKIQLNQLSAALELYRIDVGVYPELIDDGLKVLITDDGKEGWAGPYVKNEESIMDPWKQEIKLEEDDEGVWLVSYGSDLKIGGEGNKEDIRVFISK